jgi:hypothetical protein
MTRRKNMPRERNQMTNRRSFTTKSSGGPVLNSLAIKDAVLEATDAGCGITSNIGGCWSAALTTGGCTATCAEIDTWQE